tara:strand:- start:20 stop:514 length:495 start_codon:yes stop_codon:yes gene_type:complete
VNKKEDIIKLIKELKIPEFEKDPELLKKTLDSIEQYSNDRAEKDIGKFRSLANQRIRNIDGIPSPLSREESAIFDKKLLEIKEKINTIKNKVDLAKESVGKQIDEEDEHFILDISKNKSFQIAAKNIFGEKKKEITHKDYLRLLEIRNENSKEEKKSFVDFGES